MDTRLIWVDLEMTGLDADQHTIVEIATIITDAELNVVAEGPELVIYQPESALARMDEFVTNLHTKNGLLEKIRASTVSLAEAEAATFEFVKPYCKERTSPLCGNSIHKDRQFLERHMATFAAHLHYRNVDVSTLKELVRGWYGERVPPFVKGEKHRAKDDILESIAELRYYRERVFVPVS